MAIGHARGPTAPFERQPCAYVPPPKRCAQVERLVSILCYYVLANLEAQKLPNPTSLIGTAPDFALPEVAEEHFLD
jgi:hypothetical protein